MCDLSATMLLLPSTLRCSVTGSAGSGTRTLATRPGGLPLPDAVAVEAPATGMGPRLQIPAVTP